MRLPVAIDGRDVDPPVRPAAVRGGARDVVVELHVAGGGTYLATLVTAIESP